jgi:hypothetical protein
VRHWSTTGRKSQIAQELSGGREPGQVAECGDAGDGHGELAAAPHGHTPPRWTLYAHPAQQTVCERTSGLTSEFVVYRAWGEARGGAGVWYVHPRCEPEVSRPSRKS